jgi:hypothetical protein
MRAVSFVVLAIIGLTGCATTSSNKGSEKAITVSQSPRGAVVTVSERILFDTGKSVLKPDALDVLGNISTILNEKTKKDILIEGHTDNLGSTTLNNKLSENRAEAVKVALVARGVRKERLQILGVGATQPKADNATEDGRRINRRTEITILGENKDNLKTDGVDLEAALNGVWLKLKQMFQYRRTQCARSRYQSISGGFASFSLCSFPCRSHWWLTANTPPHRKNV